MILTLRAPRFKAQKLKALATVSLAALLLVSCGGGGSSSSSTPTATAPPPTAVTPPTTTPVVSSGPTFTPNVFEDEDEFVAQCEIPRTGTDPATGRAFVDEQGSELIEKFWLRSWNDRTYLFFDEVTDVDPSSIDPTTGAEYTRLGYFDILRTERITASGAPVDQFHFTQDTAERFQVVSTGASAGYGSEYAFLASRAPRDVRIAFTEAGSPFAAENVARGARILEVDGVDLVNGTDVDTLNAGLFPSDTGETHSFVIEDTAGAEPRTVTVTSATFVSDPVFQSTVIDEGDGRVGYVVFNSFGTSIAEEQLFDAFTELADAEVDDLVLDLRYNGGGFLTIASQLGYMIAGSQSANQTFETLQFNSKFPTTNPITGQRIEPTPFIDESRGFTIPSGRDLPTLNLNRVFILSTAGTCSASEALINGLRGIDVEVILVGDTTCGKPFGFFITDNCGVSYATIQFRGVNAQNFGDYTDGFTPSDAGTDSFGERVEGCSIDDDFGSQLGDTQEGLLSGALTYRSTGACPVPAAAGSKVAFSGSSKSSVTDGTGPSLFDSPIYQRELNRRQSLLRDNPPSMVDGNDN